METGGLRSGWLLPGLEVEASESDWWPGMDSTISAGAKRDAP
jgi:hypothetical protein